MFEKSSTRIISLMRSSGVRSKIEWTVLTSVDQASLWNTMIMDVAGKSLYESSNAVHLNYRIYHFFSTSGNFSVIPPKTYPRRPIGMRFLRTLIKLLAYSLNLCLKYPSSIRFLYFSEIHLFFKCLSFYFFGLTFVIILYLIWLSSILYI